MSDWTIQKGILVLNSGSYTANVWVSRQIGNGPGARFEWAVGPIKTGVTERHGYAATAADGEKAALAALDELRK